MFNPFLVICSESISNDIHHNFKKNQKTQNIWNWKYELHQSKSKGLKNFVEYD